MTFKYNTFGLLVLGASVLGISACNYNHPTQMPSGYTYHHDTYKSATPPLSSKITIEQRKYMDETQAEQFRSAVYDLLERVTMRAGMPPKPVYIQAPTPMNTFYANIDNDLRESMRHIGYAISDTPTGAYIFTYEALPIIQPEGAPTTNVNNVELTLRVFDSLSATARQLTVESGRYYIQGAESLNIEGSRYDVLPTQKQIEKQQMQMGAAQPVMQETMTVPMAPPMTSPMVQQFAEPQMPAVSAPTSMDADMGYSDSSDDMMVPTMPPEIEAPAEPVMDSTPVFNVPKVSKPAMEETKTNKKPSADDIIVINRGDVSVDNDVPMMPVVEPEYNALQEAIPDATNASRGRVSPPANY